MSSTTVTETVPFSEQSKMFSDAFESFLGFFTPHLYDIKMQPLRVIG